MPSTSRRPTTVRKAPTRRQTAENYGVGVVGVGEGHAERHQFIDLVWSRVCDDEVGRRPRRGRGESLCYCHALVRHVFSATVQMVGIAK
jgi:hypothetical protein